MLAAVTRTACVAVDIGPAAAPQRAQLAVPLITGLAGTAVHADRARRATQHLLRDVGGPALGPGPSRADHRGAAGSPQCRWAVTCSRPSSSRRTSPRSTS